MFAFFSSLNQHHNVMQLYVLIELAALTFRFIAFISCPVQAQYIFGNRLTNVRDRFADMTVAFVDALYSSNHTDNVSD